MSTLKILLADDDSADRELFLEGIQKTNPGCKVDQVRNGQEVLSYLDMCKEFPDLIFLDLNMPVMGGREALVKIKQSEKLSVIPVFILSTSSSPIEVFESYKAGANLFLVKPCSFDALVKMQKNIMELFQETMATAEVV